MSDIEITVEEAPAIEITVDNNTAYVIEIAGSGGASTLTTKGDLLGFSVVADRIPVGTDDQILTADSTSSVGISWQDPAVIESNKIFEGDSSIEITDAATGEIVMTVDDRELISMRRNGQPITISDLGGFCDDNTPLVLISSYGGAFDDKGCVLWLDTTRTNSPVDIAVFKVSTASGEIFSIDNAGGLKVNAGQRVDEFSIDGTLAGNSDTALPTEKAVKTYVDTEISDIDTSPLTTKGDLYTYSTDNERLGVGSDDYVLTADSTEATGLKWAALPEGNIISQLDSSVEVNDTGTDGEVVITVDSTELITIEKGNQPITISNEMSDYGDNTPLVLIESTGTSLTNKGALLWLDTNRGAGVVDIDVFRIDNSSGEIFSIDNAGGIQVNQGQRIDEFSTDGTMAGNSDSALPTEQAVKTYVDTEIGDIDTSPLTTKGDLFTYDTANARLPIGTNDYVLTADSSEATGMKWAASSSGFTDPMTTRGDIIYKSSTATTRLPIGTDGQVLTSDGTDISWEDSAGGTSDKIEEGNSSVEVVDTGTGYISHTVEGTEVVRIDTSTLRVGEGLDQSYSGDIIMVSDGGACVFGGRSFSTTAVSAPRFEFGRVGGSLASPASVSEGDRIGGLNTLNYAGTGFQYTGGIFFINDGAPSAGVGPTKIAFETGTTNTASRAERLVIRADGCVEPGADDSQDFGSSSKRWTDIYATNATIQTSDKRLKRDIVDTDFGLDFINALAPKTFKWNDYNDEGYKDVEQYSEDGELLGTKKEHYKIKHKHNRKHHGLMAQDVEKVVKDLGKGNTDFAGIIYDEKTDTYGLRYGEFIAPLIKAIQEQQTIINALIDRIEKIERR